MIKKFKTTHLFFHDSEPEYFDESNPPSWVTMDGAWWYNGYVLKLEIGESIDTDFNKVTRIE